MEEIIFRDSVQTAISSNAEETSSKSRGVVESSADVPSALVDEELRKELSNIPDKMAFKIGEVADMLGVKTYVLRYWETEFDSLRPRKSSSNQRMYARKNVETAFLIKKLLYRDRFSIQGARKALKGLKSEVKETKQWDQVVSRYDKAILEMESLIESIEAARTHFK